MYLVQMYQVYQSQGVDFGVLAAIPCQPGALQGQQLWVHRGCR